MSNTQEEPLQCAHAQACPMFAKNCSQEHGTMIGIASYAVFSDQSKKYTETGNVEALRVALKNNR